MIREIKGSVAIQTDGHLETVIVKNLLKGIGKPINNEALKALGITVQVAEHKKNLGREYGGPESLKLYFTWGPQAIIHRYDVLDGQGRIVELAGWTGNDNACAAAELLGTFQKKLDADTQLRIVVHKDSRKIRVPFVFKNVSVPQIDDDMEDFETPTPSAAAETLPAGDLLLKGIKLDAEAYWAAVTRRFAPTGARLGNHRKGRYPGENKRLWRIDDRLGA